MGIIQNFIGSSGTLITGQVVLLLHFDGSQGSSTFTDSSSHGHVVTPVGNAHIDTNEFKFGGAAGLFDGNGDFLLVPDSDDWWFGAGDFTIALWARAVSLDPPAPLNFPTLLGQRAGGTSNVSWLTYWAGSSGSFAFNYSANGSTVLGTAFVQTPPLNTWFHIEWCRVGSNLYGFYNGDLRVTHNIGAVSLFNSTAQLSIGAIQNVLAETYWNGRFDELIIIKNQGLHTASFTPPSAPYPDP